VVSINELSIEFDEKRQKLEDILNEYEQEVSEATSYRDRMEPKEEFTYTTRMG
jgi:sulfur carrier protein ThiS